MVREIPTAIEAWDSGSTVNARPRARSLSTITGHITDSKCAKNDSSKNFASKIPKLVKERHMAAKGRVIKNDLDVLEKILRTIEEIQERIHEMGREIQERNDEIRETKEETNAIKDKINAMESKMLDLQEMKIDVSSIKHRLRCLYGNRF